MSPRRVVDLSLCAAIAAETRIAPHAVYAVLAGTAVQRTTIAAVSAALARRTPCGGGGYGGEGRPC